MAQKTFVIGSDGTIGIDVLLDASVTPNVPVPTATCTGELRDADDDSVLDTGISCAHVAAGNYSGLVADTVTALFTVGQRILIEIVADDGPGRKRVFTDVAVAIAKEPC